VLERARSNYQLSGWVVVHDSAGQAERNGTTRLEAIADELGSESGSYFANTGESEDNRLALKTARPNRKVGRLSCRGRKMADQASGFSFEGHQQRYGAGRWIHSYVVDARTTIARNSAAAK